LGPGRGWRMNRFAGALAPAPARLRIAWHQVARRRSRRLGKLWTWTNSPSRRREGRGLGRKPHAGTKKPAIRPQNRLSAVVHHYCRMRATDQCSIGLWRAFRRQTRWRVPQRGVTGCSRPLQRTSNLTARPSRNRLAGPFEYTGKRTPYWSISGQPTAHFP
jgi:hypothetical protein